MSLSGENVYDLSLFTTRMHESGWSIEEGVWGFTHPPYLFWIYSPLGLLPLPTAIVFWFSLIFISLLLIFKLSENYISQNSNQEKSRMPTPLVWFAVFSFIPIIKIICFGQVSFILGIGLLSSLILYQKKHDLSAGLTLSLVLIKPHLIFAFLLAWLIRSIAQKRFLFSLGIFFGTSLQFFISYLWYREGLLFYLEAINNISTRAPGLAGNTISQILSYHFNISGMSFPIWIFSWIIGILFSIRKKITLSTLTHVLIPLSLLCAPYSFSHELILLLPTYLVFLAMFYQRVGDNAKYFCLAMGLAGSLMVAMIRYEFLAITIPVFLFIFGFRLCLKERSNDSEALANSWI